MVDQAQLLTQSIMKTVSLRSEQGLPYLSLKHLKSIVKQDTQIDRPDSVATIVRSLIEIKVLSGYVSSRTVRGITKGEKFDSQPDTDGNDNRQYLEQIEELTRERNVLNGYVKDYRAAIGRYSDRIEQLKALNSSERVVEVQLKQGNKVVKKIKDVFHKEFGRLLDLAKARKNIFIYGPTGCGKSHVCKQLADSLGLRFAFVSCTVGMSEGVLAGRLLPVGDGGSFSYVISEFIDCYENGGLFLLDEIDAADPNVLLLVNAALANGKVAVPNRPEKPYAERHKDFVCVAAANTAGTNADRLYSGRNKLDGATLDRFQIGKVVFDYDKEVEEQLCPDKELLEKCWTIRKAINENRLERAMSTRFIVDAYEMKYEFKWDDDKIFAAFFSGWREDEKNKVTSFI